MKEALPLRLLTIFQELVHQDDNWQRDRDLFGIQRTNIQRQKSHPLYWPQTEAFLANMNVVGQCGEVEESAQNVVNVRTATYQIGQLRVIAEGKNSEKC